MILSIIIPYYNTENYTKQLLRCLDRQMKPDVEVILVDDGSRAEFDASYDWLRIIRQKNGGASKARNKGLDNAQGEYIAFIDSDDLVTDNYIRTILKKIEEEHFDYCYLSWKTMPGGWDYKVKLGSIDDKFPPFNLCVWNRIYRRDMIGSVRFNTKKAIAEDAQFIREVKEKDHKKAFIPEFMYLYRSQTENSLTKRFANGCLDMNRIVYYFPKVSANMQYLIDEFKEADKTAEVILMTHQNEIPELEDYAMIMAPQRIKGTELRGKHTPLYEQILKPEEFQVVIWTAVTFSIGGIETWIYNFCQHMHDRYDILVLYDKIDTMQMNRLMQLVEVRRNDPKQKIICDTLIINRITDKAPDNITYGHRVQMVHGCRLDKKWTVPEADTTIFVSEAARKTFPEPENKTCVIHNMTWPTKEKAALVLVSATRVRTFEKGMKRMVAFANQLKRQGIPFVWMIFADGKIEDATEEMIITKPILDISPIIRAADYLVQLSDAEAFGYSIVESLEAGTPVITTPIDVLPELGVVDEENGYIVPFEITDKVDLQKIYDRRLKPVKGYTYLNDPLEKQWIRILGKKKKKQRPKAEPVRLKCIRKYRDMQLGRIILPDEIITVTPQRAQAICGNGFCVRI